MVASKHKRRPGILDALITILIDPSGTIHHLLDHRRWPPHVIILLLLFSLIVVAPPFLYSVDGVTNTANLPALQSTLVTIFLTMVLSSVFFTILLRTLGSPVRWIMTFGALVYALTPITVIIAAVYCLNYVTVGYFSIFQFLSFGYVTENDWVVALFPITFKVSCALCILLLIHGARVLCRASFSSSLLLGAIYIPLILGSFVVSASAVEIAAPLSSEAVIRFFLSFFNIR